MKFFTAVALFGAASALKLRSQQTAEEILEGAGELLDVLGHDHADAFDWADADGNGSLTGDEVLAAARSEEAAAAYEAAMASEDVPEETKAALRWVKRQMEDESITDEERKEWLGRKFGGLDTDGVAGLSKEELGISDDSDDEEETTLAQDGDVDGTEIVQETAELFEALGLTEEDALEIFTAVDGDGNGQITGEEALKAARSPAAKKAFKKVMGHEGVSDEHKEALQWAADQLETASDEEILGWLGETFGHLDTDGTEGLSVDELTAVLAQVGEDVDGTELIREGAELFEALGLTEEDALEIFTAVDGNGNGQITGAELLRAARSPRAKEAFEHVMGHDDVSDEHKEALEWAADQLETASDEEILGWLDETFGHLDTDGEAGLSVEEIGAALV